MGNELPKLASRVTASKLDVSGDAPSSREAAAAVALSDTELLMFGGGGVSGEEAVQFDETWLLTVPANGGARWRRVETCGEAPCARTGHAMACVDVPGGGRAVVLVGGCSGDTGHLSDAHVLDCATWKWSAVPHSELAPSPRDKLSAVAFGDRVVVFGGFGPPPADAAAAGGASSGEEEEEEAEEEEDDADADAKSDDAPAASFTWFNDVRQLQREGGSWTWSAPATQGDAPSPRAAHAAAAVGGRMLLFGGRDASGRTNDTHALDIATMTWTRAAEGAAAPAKRSFHTLVSLHPHPGAACFGGIGADDAQLDSLDILDARGGGAAWAQPAERAGAWPPARALAASALLGSRLVLVASSDGQPCSSTVLELTDVAQELATQPKAQ